MKTNKLISVRVRQGKSRKYMAGLIEKEVDSYAKKEKGVVKFTPDEIVVVSQDLSEDLEFTFDEFNDIFFDGKLPFGNVLVKEGGNG